MAQSDDEDDYMKMVFEDPRAKETSLQRRMRIEREGASRGYTKSKADIEADAVAAREAGLNTAIDPSSKGAKMLAKLGYKQGDALGKSQQGLKEPLRPVILERRSGIGMESAKKRKFKEMMGKMELDKLSEEDYLAYKKQVSEDKKMESMITKAQKTAERLEEKRGGKEASASSEPLKCIHVTWRGLVRHRLERKQAEDDLQMPRLKRARKNDAINGYEDDHADNIALGGNTPELRELEDDLEEEDKELEAFEALPLEDRLKQIVAHLRERFFYCFWCAHLYPNSDMDGCPGETEDDHDCALEL